MLNYIAAYKYKTPYKGPFFIMQCFDQCHGHITIWCDKKLSIIYIAISHKLDTKVEYYNSTNMYDAVNIWITIHILLYYIKSWNKVYDQIHTATFDGNSYRPCAWSFYDKVFSSQRLHL